MPQPGVLRMLFIALLLGAQSMELRRASNFVAATQQQCQGRHISLCLQTLEMHIRAAV
jgi:hypothetical protein